ncbi:MAG: hypothetical protein HQ567_25720, partial [Candidatus Nealsonbacteria bacterium]|nr:hypothetical protein [Candidatus Nealsonbacteria bacterium]
MLSRTTRKSFATATLRAAVVLVLLFGAVAARADEADDQYAIAAGHYGQGRWKMAVEEFRKFLDGFPNHA